MFKTLCEAANAGLCARAEQYSRHTVAHYHLYHFYAISPMIMIVYVHKCGTHQLHQHESATGPSCTCTCTFAMICLHMYVHGKPSISCYHRCIAQPTRSICWYHVACVLTGTCLHLQLLGIFKHHRHASLDFSLSLRVAVYIRVVAIELYWQSLFMHMYYMYPTTYRRQGYPKLLTPGHVM